MLEDLFRSILLTSCVGTGLALVLLALRPLTKRYFSSNWHYYLWFVVLVVMMVPFRLSLPVRVLPTVSPSVSHTIERSAEADTTAPPSAPRADGHAHAVTVTTESYMATASRIWFAGAVLLFSIKLLRYAVFWRRIRRNTHPDVCPETAAFTKRTLRVRVGAAISSPQLVGLFKPTLLLPETPLSAEQLGHVLSHEMMHLKRKDLIYKWFAFLVKCVHWFNPMVYIVNRQIRAECEISCDLAVVKAMDEHARVRYIQTILYLLSGKSEREAPFTTEMVGNKRALKRRFLMIKTKPQISKRARRISVAAAGVLIVLSLGVSGVLAGSARVNTQTQADNTPHIVLEPTTVTSTASTEPTVTTTSTEVPTTSTEVTTTSTEVPTTSTEVTITPTTVTTTSTERTTASTEGTTITTAVVLAPADTAFCWPCPESEQITTGFGYRWGKAHTGIDIYADVGFSIVAVADGTVIETNSSGWGGGYGIYVVLDHGNGLTTKYGCLDSLNVTVGQTVGRGQEIGRAGNTGDSTGPHLHFEVLVDGVPQNPERFF